jgi:hypothetical protein
MSRCERTVAPSWSRRMRAAIDAEYAEVLERLPDFFTELDAETTRGRVTFAEVEESEADLARFRAWVAKIAARDYFTAADAEALAGLVDVPSVSAQGKGACAGETTVVSLSRFACGHAGVYRYVSDILAAYVGPGT